MNSSFFRRMGQLLKMLLMLSLIQPYLDNEIVRNVFSSTSGKMFVSVLSRLFNAPIIHVLVLKKLP